MTPLIRKLLSAALISVGALVALPAIAQIDAVLPFPGDGSGAVFDTCADNQGNPARECITIDGIFVAFKYDDVWSYSFPILDALQGAGFLPAATFGSYDFSVGVGTQDAVLATQAGGQDNDPVGIGDCCTLEEPGDTLAGSTIFVETWWGQNDQDDDGTPDGTAGSCAGPDICGPNTVQDVLDFLASYDPTQTIPVFITDWNQTGAEDSIFASARAYICSDATDCDNTIVAEWSLDTDDDGNAAGPGVGDFDRNDQAFNFGEVSFYGSAVDCAADPFCAGVTDSGNDYAGLQHNIGSGKPDFVLFAPTMDLSLYDPAHTFVVQLVLGCEGGMAGDPGCGTNGAEEIFMTGRIAGAPPPMVPEPTTALLVGLGLIGLGGRGLIAGRRRYRAAA